MLYGKLPIVFLSTLASEKKDSTNSQIATYLLNHLDDIKIPFLFHITITPYKQDVEPNVPNKRSVIEAVKKISEKIGAYQSNLALGNTFGLQTDMSQQYSENTKNIVNGLEHISDNIIRSQIIYDQKSRLLSKLFDFQNCITHFKSLYSAKEFYIRYRSEKAYKNNASSKDKFIYDTLQATIMAYYNKYCNCVSNIYKYYDSCSELIGECLNMQSQIFVSRKILNK